MSSSVTRCTPSPRLTSRVISGTTWCGDARVRRCRGRVVVGAAVGADAAGVAGRARRRAGSPGGAWVGPASLVGGRWRRDGRSRRSGSAGTGVGLGAGRRRRCRPGRRRRPGARGVSASGVGGLTGVRQVRGRVRRSRRRPPPPGTCGLCRRVDRATVGCGGGTTGVATATAPRWASASVASIPGVVGAAVGPLRWRRVSARCAAWVCVAPPAGGFWALRVSCRGPALAVVAIQGAAPRAWRRRRRRQRCPRAGARTARRRARAGPPRLPGRSGRPS